MALDRRTFIKVAGAQTGLLAAGGKALDAATPSPAPGSAPPTAPYISRQLPDILVVGAGAFGGWTALNLQKMGAKVLLVDEYGAGNARATSGDETRGVRTSYGDRPHGELWARWARQAIDRWKNFDENWGCDVRANVFHTTGDVILRKDWDNFLDNTQKIFETVGIPHEVLPIDDVAKRWPVLGLKDINHCLYEPEAGVVRARRSCEAVAAAFVSRGGEILVARARPGTKSGNRLNDVALSTYETRSAGQYVFAVGPWFQTLFPEVMGNRMRTPVGYVFYLATPPGDPSYTYPHLPSWNYPGVTGWPALPVDNRGFRVRTGGGGVSEPDTSSRYIEPKGLERQQQFVAERFPGLVHAPISQTHACHYELTPSRNFMFTPHPDMENLFLAGGGNAEGFKFGPVIGEYVAGRVLGTETDEELAKQFALPEEYEEMAEEPMAQRGTARRGN
jgi:glycine/D-amino acid oxidase-like deaminating enzyme